MRHKKAYLSGTNRLTCVQARAICACIQKHEAQSMRGEGTQQEILDSAVSKVHRSIHPGRLANFSKDNHLTLDEVAVLITFLNMVLHSRIYANGYEKNAIEGAINKLRLSSQGPQPNLRGRNRLDTLRSDPDSDDIWDEYQTADPKPNSMNSDTDDLDPLDDDSPF